MAFYIDKKGLEVNSGLRKQHGAITQMRESNFRHESALAQSTGMAVNADLIGPQVWLDFDNQTRALMLGDEGSGLLGDLMPLARNVNIGKLVAAYRSYGETELEVRTSMDGQHAKPVNHTNFDYDGVLVPVHSTQVGRNWRELEGLRSEGMDELLVDQENAVRFVRRRTIDNFVNGTDNLEYKGFQAYGLKNSPNTIAINLGAGGMNIDLTDPAVTYPQAYNALIGMLQQVQGGDNNAVGEVTLYVSSEIYFNLSRINEDQAGVQESILTGLLRTPGVAAIKKTDMATGNELFGVILSAQYIQPIIGMPFTTTPIARRTPMDDWHVLVWGASGLQIKADGAGRSGVFYASEGA